MELFCAVHAHCRCGFFVRFPLRLLFGIRIVVSETFVWAIAISINVFALIYFRGFYETTFITQLMQGILTTPYPYWSVIFLSLIGFFSLFALAMN